MCPSQPHLLPPAPVSFTHPRSPPFTILLRCCRHGTQSRYRGASQPASRSVAPAPNVVLQVSDPAQPSQVHDPILPFPSSATLSCTAPRRRSIIASPRGKSPHILRLLYLLVASLYPPWGRARWSERMRRNVTRSAVLLPIISLVLPSTGTQPGRGPSELS